MTTGENEGRHIYSVANDIVQRQDLNSADKDGTNREWAAENDKMISKNEEHAVEIDEVSSNGMASYSNNYQNNHNVIELDAANSLRFLGRLHTTEIIENRLQKAVEHKYKPFEILSTHLNSEACSSENKSAYSNQCGTASSAVVHNERSSENFNVLESCTEDNRNTLRNSEDFDAADSLKLFKQHETINNEQDQDKKQLLEKKNAKRDKESWLSKYREVALFASETSHINAADIDSPCHGLKEWVDEQNSQYRLMAENKPSAITVEQFSMLQELNFPLSDLKSKGTEVNIEKQETHTGSSGKCQDRGSNSYPTSVGRFEDNFCISTGTISKKNGQILPAMHTQEVPEELPIGVKNAPNEAWEMRYADLEKFYEAHGHCRVPAFFKEFPLLGRWVSTQRAQYKHMQNGKPSNLTEERLERLKRLGFSFCTKNNSKHLANETLPDTTRCKRAPGDDFLILDGKSKRRSKRVDCPDRDRSDEILWYESLQKLEQYKKIHGHCKVPIHDTRNASLRSWVRTQRRLFNQGVNGDATTLTSDQIKLLSKVGAISLPKDAAIPAKLPRNNFNSSRRKDSVTSSSISTDTGSEATNSTIQSTTLVGTQRVDDESSKCPRLERCELKWLERYEELVRYKKERGDFYVTAKSEPSKGLGAWVHWQRYLNKSDELLPERKVMLDNIGFSWVSKREAKSATTQQQSLILQQKKDGNTIEELLNEVRRDKSKWAEWFEKLRKFRLETGHCCATSRNSKIRGLATWVSRQRHKKKNMELSSVQIELLDDIGFPWVVNHGTNCRDRCFSSTQNEPHSVNFAKVKKQTKTKMSVSDKKSLGATEQAAGRERDDNFRSESTNTRHNTKSNADVKNLENNSDWTKLVANIIKPLHKSGDPVWAAWAEGNLDREYCWYSGVVVSSETVNHSSYGDVKTYHIHYDDGRENLSVEEIYVLKADDYNIDALVDDWKGVHRKRDKFSDDVYVRRRGWYTTDLTGSQVFATLGDAMRAYDEKMIRLKGAETLKSDLNLPHEWSFLWKSVNLKSDNGDVQVAIERVAETISTGSNPVHGFQQKGRHISKLEEELENLREAIKLKELELKRATDTGDGSQKYFDEI